MKSIFLTFCLWAVMLATAWAMPEAEVGADLEKTAAAAYAAKEYAKARDIWQTLAAQGHVQAQYELGALYERGQGVTKNERDAAAWYSMAASAQHTDAQARLGQLYRDGKGVRKNATRATLLLYAAAMEGHEQARKDLAALAPPRVGKNTPKAVLFGVELATATRERMRTALAQSGVPVVREDTEYICDVYNVRDTIPGATELAACYGTIENAHALGFIKIDYDSPDEKQAERIKAMVTGRFGSPAAGEGTQAWLWNLGSVIVATQYAPQMQQLGLMYMVPRVYPTAKPVPAKDTPAP